MKNVRLAIRCVAAWGLLAICLAACTTSALAQNRDPYGMYGPSSQPGAGQRQKSGHVLEARDLSTGQVVGKTLDRVIFIDVLDLRPFDGPGNTFIYPGYGPYSYILLNQNDGVGNHIQLGVVERPDDTGLMGIWHLDGNALDSSGNGHHGTISDSSHVTSTGGVSGSSYHFDGQGSIDVGNLDFTGGAYTVSMWMRMTEPAMTEVWRMAIAKGDGVSGDQTFEIAMGDGRTNVEGFAGGNAPYYLVWKSGQSLINTAPEGTASGMNARDGNWHMLTATYTTGTQRFYVDGVLLASRSFNGPLPLVSNGVTIGGFEGFGPYHHRWVGDLDEVTIYGRALSGAEVAGLYGAAPTNTEAGLSVRVQSMTRSATEIRVVVRIDNTSSTHAREVRITSATLGGVNSQTKLPLGIVGGIPAGGYTTKALVFPASAGPHGAVVNLNIGGAWLGGTFTLNQSVTLP